MKIKLGLVLFAFLSFAAGCDTFGENPAPQRAQESAQEVPLSIDALEIAAGTITANADTLGWDGKNR